MGCANGKILTLPTTPKNGISPIEVSDAVGRMNFINHPPPKVVISEDFLEEKARTAEVDGNGNGGVTGPDILNLEEKLDSGLEKISQEIDLLSIPDVPPDDDKVAVVDMIIEETMNKSPEGGLQDDMRENDADDIRVTTNVEENLNVEGAAIDDNGNDIAEVANEPVVITPEPTEADENCNEIQIEEATAEDVTDFETKIETKQDLDDLLITDEE